MLGHPPLAPPPSTRLLSRMHCSQAGPPACVLVHTQSYTQLPKFCCSGGRVALPVCVLVQEKLSDFSLAQRLPGASQTLVLCRAFFVRVLLKVM